MLHYTKQKAKITKKKDNKKRTLTVNLLDLETNITLFENQLFTP